MSRCPVQKAYRTAVLCMLGQAKANWSVCWIPNVTSNERPSENLSVWKRDKPKAGENIPKPENHPNFGQPWVGFKL